MVMFSLHVGALVHPSNYLAEGEILLVEIEKSGSVRDWYINPSVIRRCQLEPQTLPKFRTLPLIFALCFRPPPRQKSPSPKYDPHPISIQNKITRVHGLQFEPILDPPAPAVWEKKGTPQQFLGGDNFPPQHFSRKIVDGECALQ